MQMLFTVTYDDGKKVESVAKPKDIVAFERQYGKSMASFGDASNPPPMEWVYYLAWSPLHRQGREPRAFDEFLDAVADVEPKEAPDVDPTPPDLSVEPSPT